jgi:hypothetical protein
VANALVRFVRKAATIQVWTQFTTTQCRPNFVRYAQSANRRKFPAEMNIHFPGMKNLTKPTVWLFR